MTALPSDKSRPEDISTGKYPQLRTSLCSHPHLLRYSNAVTFRIDSDITKYSTVRFPQAVDSVSGTGTLCERRELGISWTSRERAADENCTLTGVCEPQHQQYCAVSRHCELLV